MTIGGTGQTLNTLLLLYSHIYVSASFEEYARKWNKPIHEFLFRHVYLASLHHLNFSKDQAAMFTFLVSSIFHELVLAIVLRKVRLYFFTFQMLQIPLIQIFRHPQLRKRKIFGNIFFWASMFLGPPLLSILYTYDSIFPFRLF
jgi:sterol O-acyltransferase